VAARFNLTEPMIPSCCIQKRAAEWASHLWEAPAGYGAETPAALFWNQEVGLVRGAPLGV
jgi:hypothetical protein